MEYTLYRRIQRDTPPDESNGFGDFPDYEIVEVMTATAATRREAQVTLKKAYPMARFSGRCAQWFILDARERDATRFC